MNALKFLLSIILSLSLTNCTPKPPDVPVCEHLKQRLTTDPVTGHLILKASPVCMKEIGEVECGHCTYIVSGKEIYIGENEKFHLNKKPWSQLREESILMPAEESYAPVATYIINSCKKMNCSDDVTRFKVKLDSLNGIKGAADIIKNQTQ
jgi:hypothetical protein